MEEIQFQVPLPGCCLPLSISIPVYFCECAEPNLEFENKEQTSVIPDDLCVIEKYIQ